MKRILIILGMLILSGCSAPGQPTEAPIIEAVAPEPVQPAVAPATEVVASEPAILSEIENDVAVRAKNETDWKSVSSVELVSDRGSVRTQTDSHARLDLPNGNVLLIGPDTIFELSNIDGQDWAIFLEQGGVILEVTAEHLGRSVISTPIGIIWPTGSMAFAGGATETITLGCLEGSCLAIPGNTLKNNASNETIMMENSFGDDTVMNFTVIESGPYAGISMGKLELITIEKKTDSEPKVSEIKTLDLGDIEIGDILDLNDREVLRDLLINLGDTTGEATIDVSNVDTSGDNTLFIEPACDLFQGAEFSHVYGPWLPGAPLPVNVKMPANVAWQELVYNLKIGGVETDACAPLEGNNTRLSCKIKLLSEYAGTYNQYALALHLDGCGEPIYSVGTLSLPVPEPNDTSEKPKDKEETNSCDPYAHDQIACESGGGIWDLVFSSCTCP